MIIDVITTTIALFWFVLIEGTIDEFECCVREGECVDYEDIEDAANCLINKIDYVDFFE